MAGIRLKVMDTPPLVEVIEKTITTHMKTVSKTLELACKLTF